jgi:hypothetical protein
MGHRALKRVPLDFDWPLNKIWKGYVNPYPGEVKCKYCDGTGLNPESRQIDADYYDHEGFGTRWTYDYGIARDGKPAQRPPWRVLGDSRTWQHNITQDEVQALVDAGRLVDLTHTWIGAKGWVRRADGYIPTADEVNEWSHSFMGHDSINKWILVKTRCKRLGVWGKCKICKGKGNKFPPKVSRHKHKAWREYEPPTGPGFQLWETVTEGSPISRVCKTVEELARWCSLSTAFAPNEYTSYETLLDMFNEEVGGKKGAVSAGSMLIAVEGVYVGSVANMPAGL